MTSRSAILSIDLGSTHFKAALFDDALSPIARGAREIETRCGANGHAEIDVAAVSAALDGCLHDVLAVPPGAQGMTLSAVALTSQAQTFAVFGTDGIARTPFISWQDSRARETAAILAQRPEFADFAEHVSFTDPLPNLLLFILHHLTSANPGIVRETDTVIPLSAFVVRELTGKVLVDENLAAMSGMYSLKLHSWWPVALEACGVRAECLPGLTAIGRVAAVADSGAARLGIRQGTPVVLAGNDQTAGAYAAGLHENDAVLLTLGTAQVAYTCAPVPPRPARGLVRGPYPGGRFYRMAADTCGGNVVDWARSVLPGCETVDGFFELAEAAPAGCDGLRFVADVPGNRGRWDNMGMNHGPPHLARAVLEGLADRLQTLVRTLIGEKTVRFLVAGGGSRSPLWVRILEDALGTELTVTRADPLLGAAAMARDCQFSTNR